MNIKKFLKWEYTPALVTLSVFITFSSMIIILFIGGALFSVNDGDAITTEKFVSTLASAGNVDILLNTLVVGFGTGFIATLGGTLYAWLVVRTDIYGKRYLRILAIVPMTLPALTKSIGWVAIFSPSVGIVNVFFMDYFGIGPIFNLYTLHGITIIMGLSSLPVGFLLMEPAIKSLSSSLEEASRISGAGTIETLVKVTGPLLAPGMLSVFLLTSIYGFGSFEYPFIFGSSQGTVETYSTIIYKSVVFNVVPKYDEAIIYSIVYTFIAFTMIILYRRLTSDQFKFETVTGRSEAPTKFKLGKWRIHGTMFCWIVAFFAFFAPLIGILGLSVAENVSSVFLSFTLKNFSNFLSMAGVPNAAWNTLLLAICAGAGVSIISLFLSYTALKTDIKIKSYDITRTADYISVMPLGLPPIVYGVTIFWLVLLGPMSVAYGTLWPLILAIVLLKIPHGTRMVSASLIQISDDLEEASRITGSSWIGTFRNVVTPLVKGGVLNAFLFVFIDAVKELSAVVLLITAGNSVLMALLLQLYSNDPNALPTIGAGSVFIALFLFVIVSGQSKLLSERI
jgi:iron(III) transport system permease protein